MALGDEAARLNTRYGRRASKPAPVPVQPAPNPVQPAPVPVEPAKVEDATPASKEN